MSERVAGGPCADVFHGQSDAIEPGDTEVGPVAFDRFRPVVCQGGATPIIAVNCDCRALQEAAAWVRYANLTRHYDSKFWKIGNEVSGNGTYGASQEDETPAQKGPAASVCQGTAIHPGQ